MNGDDLLKMVQILTDQHHDKLLCSQCQKYLSVLPVKVYKDGCIKCGRCTKNNDEGVISLYEKIAQYCLFRCLNRYEGCRKLLLGSEVAKHEETCIGRNCSCPNCEINTQMTGQELIQHFKQNHNNCLLRSNFFYLSQCTNTDKQKFLYIHDDNIFIIVYQYVPVGMCLYLYISAVTLWKLENVEQQYIISAEKLSFKQTTAKQICVSVNEFNCDHYYKIDVSNIVAGPIKFEIILDMSKISVRSYEVQLFSKECIKDKPILIEKECQTISEEQIHTVELTSEFFKLHPSYSLTACGTALYSSTQAKRTELTCSNCKQMIASNVFTCVIKSHLVCWDCKAWCGLCKCAINGWNSEMATLSESLLFPCKWKCGAKCSGGDLREHQLFCDMNKRACPVCDAEICVKFLGIHLPVVHKCEFVEEFNLASFLRKQKTGDKFYFIINNNMFKLEFGIHNRDYNVKIIPCDDMVGLELFVILGNNKCQKVDNGKITVNQNLETNPKLYLKYF